MKKNLLPILALVGALGIASPLTVFASNSDVNVKSLAFH